MFLIRYKIACVDCWSKAGYTHIEMLRQRTSDTKMGVHNQKYMGSMETRSNQVYH